MTYAHSARSTLFALVATVVCFDASGVARAGSVTVNMTGVSSTLTDWNRNLSFAQFDSSLGTLTEVDFNLTSHVQTQITIHNDSPDSYAQGNARTELLLTVNDGSVAWMPQLQVIDGLSTGFSVTALNNNLGLAPGQAAASNVLNFTGSGVGSITDAPALSNFVGLGTLSLPTWTHTIDVTALSGGNNRVQHTTYADVSGTVTYIYDSSPPSNDSPVPAPAAGLASFAGLLVLGATGAIRRRNRVGV